MSTRGGRPVASVALCLLAAAFVSAQVPGNQTPPLTPQQRSDRTALEKASELELRLHSGLGSLDADANNAIRTWDAAVSGWKKERDAGAAPYLAAGVLFDCLSRMQGVVTVAVGGENRGPYFSDMAAKRPQLAIEAFDAALRIEPSLLEARMRAARLRAPKNAVAASELERIAADSTAYPFSYLSAMSRAEVARARNDLIGAKEWYQRALVLNPRSAAAPIALSLLTPGHAELFGSTDAPDPYYLYACTVMTPSVATALADHIKLVVLK